MSFHGLIKVFAFGLFSLIVFQQECVARQYVYNYQQDLGIPSSLFSLEKDPNNNEDLTNPCEQGSDNRNSDLCAQWKAADAAKKSADWNVYIGIFASLAGALTLAAAVAAAYFAKQAVLETRRIGEAQTRAYISVREVTANAKRKSDNLFGIFLEPSIFVDNNGITPGKMKISMAEVRFYDWDKRKFYYNYTGGGGSRDIFQNRMVGPGSNFRIPFGEVGQGSVDGINDNKRILVEVGILISYIDIFDREFVEVSYWHSHDINLSTFHILGQIVFTAVTKHSYTRQEIDAKDGDDLEVRWFLEQRPDWLYNQSVA